MLNNLRRDTARLKAIKQKPFPWYVLESLLFENGYQAVFLHRLANFFKRRGIPFFGPFIHRLSLWLTGVDIAPGAEIGPGLFISHGVGLVIGDRARVGSDALILQQVTIGASSLKKLDAMPVVGDRVFIGAGARVIGGIKVGNDVIIGTNVVLNQDVPDGSRVVLKVELDIAQRRASEPIAYETREASGAEEDEGWDKETVKMERTDGGNGS